MRPRPAHVRPRGNHGYGNQPLRILAEITKSLRRRRLWDDAYVRLFDNQVVG